MIISNSKKFINIHIPKCGGTTTSNFFGRHLRPQDITLNLSPHEGWEKYLDAYQKRFKLFKHSTADEIAAAVGPENFKEYAIIAFVRNPFSRAYSAFTFTKKADAKYQPTSERYFAMKDMSFDQFVESEYLQDRKILPARPQHNWLKNGHRKVEQFRLEDVESNLSLLSVRFYGRDLANKIPRANPSSSNPNEWRNMSTNAESVIRELYADDFAFMAYEDKIDRSAV